MKRGERILAVIPARGGSKGVPRKNLRDLGGRPVIAWTIELARRIPEVDRVIVSTSRGVLAAGSDADALRGSATTLNAELVRSLKTDG